MVSKSLSPAKFFEPGLLQSKYKIKIKIFKDCGFTNICLRLIWEASKWGTLQIVASMGDILRTKEVAHNDKSNLENQTC